MPAIVTDVPTGPDAGDSEAIDVTGAAVKFCCLLLVISLKGTLAGLKV